MTRYTSGADNARGVVINSGTKEVVPQPENLPGKEEMIATANRKAKAIRGTTQTLKKKQKKKQIRKPRKAMELIRFPAKKKRIWAARRS